MPALNFQAQFASGILAMLDKDYAKRTGIKPKTTTIRAQRKNHIRKGDILYLFSGQRTKGCVRLGAAVCKRLDGIWINQDREGIVVTIDGCKLSYQEAVDVAQKDGFESLADMVRWFKMTHGLPFLGVRIHFTSTYNRKYFCNKSVKERGYRLKLETTEKTILVTPDQVATAQDDRYIRELSAKHNYGVQIVMPFGLE
jgi:hypothetical protein